MIHWFSSNRGLILISFFLAVGLVWIRGQERLDSRELSPIQVLVENLPYNLMLPQGWSPPSTSITVYGPRKTLDMIRTDQSSFRVDITQIPIENSDEEIPFLLTDAMFKSNLDEVDRQRITLDVSIKQQVVLRVIHWNIDDDPPSFPPGNPNPNRIEIPVYRMEKKVDIIVPLHGEPADGHELSLLDVTPSDILLTGKREILEQIQSVTTSALDISGLSDNPPPLYLPLDIFHQTAEIKPMDSIVNGVTVMIEFKKKGN
ncbi:MAG: YbbR-like domain-containing protein [bacterium]|jgi:YbbR domain-containing protein|nr:YbbR-like domain-containing protein [bacterium]